MTTMMRWLTVTFLAQLSYCSHGSGSVFLNNLLEDMQFDLPDIKFRLPLLGGKEVNCSIALSCSKIQIGGLKLQSKDKKRMQRVEAELNLQEITSDCTGVLYYSSDSSFLKSNHIGLEVVIPSTLFKGTWSFYWNRMPLKRVDRSQHLPVGVKMKHCKTRAKYSHDSFHVIGGNEVLSFVDQQVMNALAPLFGPFVIDPVVCMQIRLVTDALSFGLNFLRWHADWFVNHELPWHPDSIKQMERTVLPRQPVNDSVVHLDSPVVQFAHDFVSSLLASPDSTGDTMVINALIRDNLLKNGSGSDWVILDEDSEKAKKIFTGNMWGAELTLFATDVRIHGLDSFVELSIAEIVGNYTLRHRVSLDSPVHLELSLRLEEQIQRKGYDQPNRYTAPFSVHFGVESFEVVLSTLIGVDWVGFENVTLGSLLKDAPLSCLLSLFSNISIPEIRFGDQMGLSTSPILRGEDAIFPFLEAAIQTAISIAGKPLYGILRAHSSTIMQGIFETIVNPYIQKQECPTKEWPPPYDPALPDSLLIFSESYLFKFLAWVANDVIGVSGELSINRIASWAMRYLFKDHWRNNELLFPGHAFTLGPFDLTKLFPFLDKSASAQLVVSNLAISGMNQFASMNAYSVDPKMPYDVCYDLSLDNATLKFDLLVEATGLKTSGAEIRDQVSLMVEMAQISKMKTSVEGLFQIDKNSFGYFQPRHLFSSCLAFAFPPPPQSVHEYTSKLAPLGLSKFVLDLGGGDLSGSCQSCTSPFLPYILDYMSTNTSTVEFNKFLDLLFPIVEDILTNKSRIDLFGGANINYGVNNLLWYMRNKCLGKKPVEPANQGSYKKPWWIPNMKVLMVVAALVLLFILLSSLLFAKRKSSTLRRHQSERLATTLLQTDYLNTGGSSSRTSGFTPSPSLPFSAWENEGSAGETTPLGARVDDGTAVTGEESGNLTSSSPVRKDSTPREVVMEFRRRVSICDVSRQSLIQSPREIVSETDALYLLGMDRAMVAHPSISPCVAYTIALTLLLNFVLFVSGNFFTMARVVLILDLAGDQMKEVPVVTLTMEYCINLLAEADAIIFFVFIASSSGLLPWVRVVILGYAWCAPANVLTIKTRGYLLRGLESIGKWIMAILYLFMVMGASMNTTLLNPENYAKFLPPHTIEGYVEVVPMWGLISFCTAAGISTILNHIIIYYHDKIVNENMKSMCVAEGTGTGLDSAPLAQFHAIPDSLVVDGESDDDTDFSLDHHLGETDQTMDGTEYQNIYEPSGRVSVEYLKRILYHACKMFVTFALIIWPLLYLLVYSQDLYEFEFMGIAGIGVEILGNGDNGKQSRTHSLFGLLPAIIYSDPAGKTSIFALVAMSLTYGILIVIAPAVTIVVAMMLWFIPVTKRNAHRLLFLFRVSNAWSSTNVLCATLLVMALQIGRFFNVVADQLAFCPKIAGYFIGQLGGSSEESVCFGVNTSLSTGWYILLAFLVYSFLLSRTVFFMIAESLSPDFFSHSSLITKVLM
uniref:Uncharacterized protein n=1 Tax=Mucochytrium quahogii TaxID=96639 RepID=A0A7S2WGK8_9STRA|mmetsp:Transcript_5211/g.9166  ORF Transcript_5211/g.9166 Transcript_5211/m.9166 type:complete len:1497 (-) Transcript_5211:111-4601(-)